MNGRSLRSQSTGIATLMCAIFIVLGLVVARAQRPTTPTHPPTEVFHGRPVAAGEVLVAFKRPPVLDALRAEIDSAADTLIGDGRIWHARSRSRNVAALVAHLSGRNDVLYAEPNYILYADAIPNDPRFPELWGLRNIGQTVGGNPGTPGADIGAVAAWDDALGSRNTVVGVVDTGIDYTHPDLAANIWSAPARFSVTIGGRTITCAAGTHGFNAVTGSCDPLDDHFHGTHVSGTIGAVSNNGVGVAGINRYASIMGLKFLSANGSGTLANAVNAIEFAVQAKGAFPGGGANVRVLSNSWAGGGFSQALLDEIVRANQNDMLFVAAAGNSGSDNDAQPEYPGSYAVANVVAVAATNNQDALASFSNYGATSVHLGAPGVQVLSTVLGGAYASVSGTSMATPHVSGAAALLLSHCSATTAAVKSLLLDNVDRIAALAGVTISGGRLNLERAMRACGPVGNTSPTVTLTEPIDNTNYSVSSLTLRANAFDAQGAIKQVAFYAGTALIGVDPTPPFEFTWSQPPVGGYELTAVATDRDGATGTSPGVNIHVLPGPGSLPFAGASAPIPGIVEAEAFNEGGEGVGYHDVTAGNAGGQFRQTDVDVVTASDTGGGYAIGFVTSGEWLAYWVRATVAADYKVEARVASAGQGGAFHLEVDGVDVTGPMIVPNTGGWQTWQMISRSGIRLTAGSHIVRLVVDTNGPTTWLGNINYLRWTTPGLNMPPSLQLTSPAAGTNYFAPASVLLGATASDVDGTVNQVAFYNGSVLLGVDNAAPFTFTWNSVGGGDYTLSAVATDDGGATATSAPTVIHVTVPPKSTPFGRTGTSIPGTIEAEDFDEGGEGIAYHDLTAGNSGGQYRQSDVDISPTLDTGGGYTLGYVAAGEWLKYSVSVAETSSYSVDMRVASAGQGGAFHLEIDGADVTGLIAVPNTGGWQTWLSVVRSSIPLTAGPHVVRLVIDTNGSTGWCGNINALRWSVTGATPPGSSPFGGTAASVPGVIEAEKFDDGGEGVAYHDLTAGNSGGQYRVTDVDIASASDTGGGYTLGYVSAGEWMKYSVLVATSGSYTLDARVASAGQGGAFHVEVDGTDVTGPMLVPNTNGWQTWQTISRGPVTLTAGGHVVRVVVDTNGSTGWLGNINFLRFSGPAPPSQ